MHPAGGPPLPVSAPAPAYQTWTVGVDLRPGHYETVTASGGHCHWEITRPGPGGTDIVASALVRDGRATVTLRVGEVFAAHRCGTWLRTGTAAPGHLASASSPASK